LLPFEPEDELKVDGAAGEIAGETARDDGLVAFPADARGSIVTGISSWPPPSIADRCQASVRLAFVPHDGVFSETPGKGFAVTSICGEIDSDGFW